MNRSVVLFSLALALLGCRGKGNKDAMQRPSAVQSEIDVKPKRSIGKVSLGTKPEDLPKGAIVSGVAGELEGVHFLLQDGQVEDVWIEDLRKFPFPVRFEGRTLDRDAPLAELKSLFGTCEQVTAKGGVFFNCSKGVTIGTDARQRGEFIQLRLKPR
jgi:hypothetical protein